MHASARRGSRRIEVVRLCKHAPICQILAAIIVDICGGNEVARAAVGAAPAHTDATRKHGGHRIEVEHFIGNRAAIDRENAAAVILVCHRQVVGRSTVRATGLEVDAVSIATGARLIVARGWIPAVRCVRQPPAILPASTSAIAEALDMEGGERVELRTVGHAACDAARAVILVVQGLVVTCLGLGLGLGLG